MPFLSPTRTLFGSPRAPPFPTDFGCVLHRWHHVNVLLRWNFSCSPLLKSKSTCSLIFDLICISSTAVEAARCFTFKRYDVLNKYCIYDNNPMQFVSGLCIEVWRDRKSSVHNVSPTEYSTSSGRSITKLLPRYPVSETPM